VPGAQRELIFQRFWRGDRRRAGSAGLGLSIVARVVKAHGGTVTVYDAIPRGAMFVVRLRPVGRLTGRLVGDVVGRPVECPVGRPVERSDGMAEGMVEGMVDGTHRVRHFSFRRTLPSPSACLGLTRASVAAQRTEISGKNHPRV
jgi:hypothetical protein